VTTDKTTGNPVGCDAKIEVLEGLDIIETVNVPENCTHKGGVTRLVHERPGDYIVTIELDGYEKWYSDEISVKHNGCNVGTENVTAELKSQL